MADRKDWFFRQIVAEDELDEAFDALETADRSLVSDLGLGRDDTNPGEYGGVAEGLTVALGSGVNISISAGSAYDDDGRRIYIDSSKTVSLSNEGSTDAGTGGTPDGALINPAAGFELWAAVFAVYDRVLTDGRVDGNNQSVYFERTESFHIDVSAGPTQASVGDPSVDGAPRESNKVLLADVKIQGSVSGPVATEVNTSRKEVWFSVSGTPRSITELKVRDVLKEMLTLYNNHVGDLADYHSIGALGYGGGAPWADGTPNPAADVESHLDKMITDLNATSGPSAGAKKIGAAAQTGVLTTPTQATPLNLSAGTLEAQLTEIMNAVNGRVFRGGDNSIDGALLPSATGKALGSTSKRWDVFASAFNISGSITGNLVPVAAGTQDLGSSGNRWDAFIETLDVDVIGSNLVPDGDETRNLGSSSNAWLALYVDVVRPATGTNHDLVIKNYNTDSASALYIETAGGDIYVNADQTVSMTGPSNVNITSGVDFNQTIERNTTNNSKGNITLNADSENNNSGNFTATGYRAAVNAENRISMTYDTTKYDEYAVLLTTMHHTNPSFGTFSAANGYVHIPVGHGWHYAIEDFPHRATLVSIEFRIATAGGSSTYTAGLYRMRQGQAQNVRAAGAYSWTDNAALWTGTQRIYSADQYRDLDRNLYTLGGFFGNVSTNDLYVFVTAYISLGYTHVLPWPTSTSNP